MKRRVTVLAWLCILIACFVIPVSAESAATQVDSYCTITPDGDCMVNLTVTLHLEGEAPGLTFPLPPNATKITLNKASVRTTKTDSAVEVDISRIVGSMSSGDISMQFDYTLPKIVRPLDREEKKNMSEEERKKLEQMRQKTLQLELPMLSGFSFPVQKMVFVVNFPGDITTVPNFTSVYQQEGIESVLSTSVTGNIISGQTTASLNDHEGVTMKMLVSTEMFPSVNIYTRNGNPEVVPMLVIAGIAMLYWLIFLRTAPLYPYQNSVPPSDITAGELGCRLTLAGGDLSMMVLSWAQLGYILIQLDRSGRVLLHKRMDMGNERSLFEIRIFQLLFAKRKTVDATGYQYAKLCRRVEGMVPGEKTMCKTSSGNMKLFRGICCLVQVLCGVCVAMNMTAIFPLQVVLSVVLGIFGAISAWQIQEVAYRTHLRGKLRVLIGLGLCLVWIVLGWIAGQVLIPLCSVLGQLAFSYFAAYGGRRSDLNRHDVGEILGLRRYMKRISKEDLNRLLRVNPDYFFDLAPYALALGVMGPFARNFGNRKIPQCPYLMTKSQEKRSAAEWAILLRKTADRMDEMRDRIELERWMPIKFR